MPYSLNFASGGTVSFTSKPLMGTWAWELELEVPNTTNQRALNFNENNFRYLRANGGFWELRNNLAGLPNVVSTAPVTTDTRTVVRVEASNNEVSWFIDGTPQGVIGTQTDDFILNNLNNTGNFTGKVYRFDVWEDGVLVESRNKQTLTSINDRVYTDNVGTNDGALDASFPADNSQWEFYSDGGGSAVTLDSASTLPSMAATGNASATLPQPQLSASINLTQLSATGSASASLPNPQLSASVLFGQLTVSGTVSATLPNPQLSGVITFNAAAVTGSVSASLPQPELQGEITFPIVSANGNASATLPGFNLSASVTLPSITAAAEAQATVPQPTLSASVSMTAISALGTAETTEPSFSLSTNVTLPALTASGSISATLPQPSISGNITLPRVCATGYIVGGEVVITVTAQTNVTEPTFSTNVNEPTLSTNITEKTLSTNITE